MTLRQVCSDILESLSAKNLDDRLSYRYIKNILMDKAAYFVKQDAEMRKLLKLGDLWKKIDCVEMEPVSFSECIEVGCKTMMRSKEAIPDSYQTGYGYALKVFTVDYMKEYHLIQPMSYRDLVNRPYKGKTKYYWVEDNHIYTPDSEVESLVVLGMFKEDARLLDKDCPKPLDSTFSFPDYIITIAKAETVKEILGTRRQIPEDQTQNLNNKS